MQSNNYVAYDLFIPSKEHPIFSYLCHKEDCTKAFKSLLHGGSILKPLKHAGSHRLFPGSINITLMQSLTITYKCIKMSDGLVYQIWIQIQIQIKEQIRIYIQIQIHIDVFRCLIAWLIDWYDGSIWSFNWSFQCSSVLSRLHVKTSNPCSYIRI